MALAATDGPIVDVPALDPFKEWVNWLSQPKISLTFFTILFVLMMVWYRKWTKPFVALGLLLGFCVFYFGSMVIDHDYYLILTKPDNVPITIMLLGTGFCLWLAFRQAAINDERIKAGQPLIEEGKDDKVLVWPDLVYTEMICMVLATAALFIWSGLVGAPLESPANPAGPPNPSKAPWYFLGLQEMLVYFDPWMAGVLLPGMIITGLIAMPYIDVNPKGNGYYTIRERPFAITTWMFGFIILWMVLIVFGTFLRGPNWNFFGPYAYWDSHLQVPLTNINLSEYFWVLTLDQPLPENPVVRECAGLAFTFFWVVLLPVLLAKTVMRRLYDQMGPMRFYIMAIHFVIMAMLPVKMVLRWLFTLKYFVYLPEYNLNL
ncbi:MAG: hypothetical protein R3336_06315 [Phycisphaeraceae bacterium]|nr:hypothetical protein [Phycisphaeraceae bacterium]